MSFDKLSISIPKPCELLNDDMKKTPDGRFCSFCNKEVVDYTNKEDWELAELLLNSKASGCGTFKKNQLDRNLLFSQSSNIIIGSVVNTSSFQKIGESNIYVNGSFVKKTDRTGDFRISLPSHFRNETIKISVKIAEMRGHVSKNIILTDALLKIQSPYELVKLYIFDRGDLLSELKTIQRLGLF